jgi:hypothetical protein
LEVKPAHIKEWNYKARKAGSPPIFDMTSEFGWADWLRIEGLVEPVECKMYGLRFRVSAGATDFAEGDFFFNELL